MLRGGQNINELVQRYESRDAQAFYEKYRVRDFSSKFSENNILYEIPGSNSSRHNDQDKQPNMKMYFKQQRKDSLVSTFSMSSDSEFEPLNPETTKKVGIILSRLSVFMEMISRLPLPRMSVTGMGVCFLIGMFLLPRTLSSAILFPGFRLIFGNLYPAYASYKAVRTKNVKEYVKWMMYWIVFAFFSCIETFTDIFLAWFPFYYEVKVVIVLWLLSPVTKGSSTLYRKFVHPMLTKRENEIDEYISQAKEKGYTAVLQLGSKGVNYATNVIMQTAIKGGGNLVQTLKRSYSLSDLSEPDIIIQESAENDEVDEVIQQNSNRILRSRTQSMRSASGGKRVEMYFPEVDLSKANENAINYSYSNIRSSEDVSSGYSSAEPISTGLSRTASLTNASRGRLKTKKAEEKTMSSSYSTLPRTRKTDKTSVKNYRAKLDK